MEFLLHGAWNRPTLKSPNNTGFTKTPPGNRRNPPAARGSITAARRPNPATLRISGSIRITMVRTLPPSHRPERQPHRLALVPLRRAIDATPLTKAAYETPNDRGQNRCTG